MSLMTIRILAILLAHGDEKAHRAMVDPQGVFAELADIAWC